MNEKNEKDATFQGLGDNDELQHIMDEIDTLEKEFDEETVIPQKFDIITPKTKDRIKDSTTQSDEPVQGVHVLPKIKPEEKKLSTKEHQGVSFRMGFEVYGKHVDLNVNEKEGLSLKTENLSLAIEQDKLRLNFNGEAAMVVPWNQEGKAKKVA